MHGLVLTSEVAGAEGGVKVGDGTVREKASRGRATCRPALELGLRGTWACEECRKSEGRRWDTRALVEQAYWPEVKEPGRAVGLEWLGREAWVLGLERLDLK